MTLDIACRRPRSLRVKTRESFDKTRRQFVRYRATGDQHLRERLVLQHRPLARSLAASYSCGREPFDDLFQVACLALVKAVDRYDPERGPAFSSYAVPTIVGELKRHYRDGTWAIHVPHRVHDNAMRVRMVRDTVSPRLGRQRSTRALASVLDLPEGRVEDALDALGANDVLWLDQPCGDDEGHTIADTIGEEEDGYARVEQRTDFDLLLAELSPREQAVLRLRFVDDLTQCEIGERVGVSQIAVSRLLSRCLPRLKDTAVAA
jgi:RNA polymerase sigma-B factor